MLGGNLKLQSGMETNIENESRLEALEIACPNTIDGFRKLRELDESFVGTADYMGIAYFWNHEYRHDLRDASPIQRVNVHRSFLEFDLPLAGTSDLHQELIDTALGSFTIAE